MGTASVARSFEPVRTQKLRPPRDVRVLRWLYRRDGEQLECEVSLTPDLSAYELRVFPSRFAHAPATQRFDDAISALEQQLAFERSLVGDGWHLDHFEQKRA